MDIQALTADFMRAFQLQHWNVEMFDTMQLPSFSNLQVDLSDVENEFVDDEFTFFDQDDEDLEDGEEVMTPEYEQALFEWPDYCVCVRPTKKQMKRACSREVKVMQGIDPDPEETEKQAKKNKKDETAKYKKSAKDDLDENSEEDTPEATSPYRPYDFCYDVWDKFGIDYVETKGKKKEDEAKYDKSRAGQLDPMFVKPDGFDIVENDKGKKKKRKKTKKYTSNAKFDALAQYELDLEDFKTRKAAGEENLPKRPKKVNMSINGYWNKKGMCTCYKPTTLPLPLITTFQVISSVWQLDTMLLYALPWALIVWAWNLVDLLLDLVFLAIFAFYKPVAFVFIWILNVVQLPIALFGYTYRLLFEAMGFIIDFWLLFAKGDGCFLRWGKNCFNSKRIPFRTNATYLDMAWLTGGQFAVAPASTMQRSSEVSLYQDLKERYGFGMIKEAIQDQKVAKELRDNIKQQGQQRRKNRAQQLFSAFEPLQMLANSMSHSFWSLVDF